MVNSKGVLIGSAVTSLVFFISTNLLASTPEIPKAFEMISRGMGNVEEPILPKSNDYSGEDELPIPEGVKPIQGMNIPLNMREVKIYGLDHKPYGVALLRKAISNATKYHNTLKGAPALKGNYRIQRKGKSYSILVNSQSYLAFVYALAQEVTQKYQSDQFLLARAIVPEQTINQSAGSIEICVAEGYLATDPVLVLPENLKNAAKIKSLLTPHLSHLTKLKPLDFKKLERSLLLIRDMSGVEIKTTFKQAVSKKDRGTTSSSICQRALNNGAGSTQLEVRANVDTFDGEVSIDNYGTDALGPEIMRFKVGVNSYFKAGDRYALSIGNATDSGESLSFSFNAESPIGISGLKAKLFHSDGDAEPGGFIDGLNVTNATVVTGLSLEYPYIRSRKKNLTFEIGLRKHNVVTDSAAGELENSNLNTLRLRSIYDFSDKYNGVNLISGELVVGLSGDFSNGTVRDETNQLDENFIMARGELARYQAINLGEKYTGSMTWINSLSWQYTDDPLFSSEEFALGGRDYGRGYDLAIITGDQAIALKTELQYTNKFKYGTYKAYGFADYGKVKNLDFGSDEAGTESQSLSSIGIGVDFMISNNWFSKIEITNPISLSVEDIEEDAKAYIQIGYRW